MIRAIIPAAAIALSSQPLAAQNHSAHQTLPAETEKDAVDHCAMGHLPPEKCPPKDNPTTADNSDEHRAHNPKSSASAGKGHAGHSRIDHSTHTMPGDKSAAGAAPESAVPARAFEGPRHAADAIWGEQAMAPSRAQLARENGAMRTGSVMLERLEARIGKGNNGYVWDAQGWYGGDIDRFVVKTEGEGAFSENIEEGEVQALWSHAIAPFFDLQAGVRLDFEPETRSHAVLGIQGLAPYMWHLDAAAFLSDRGDLSARFEAEYDQKITQSLILQPRIEIELAAQDIPEREVGAGLTKIESGLRLRYEISREFAPYIGVEYEAKTGRTASIARAAGEEPDAIRLVLGIRAWF